MGDDTWDGLFPESFHKKYFFDSFNTKVSVTTTLLLFALADIPSRTVKNNLLSYFRFINLADLRAVHTLFLVCCPFYRTQTRWITVLNNGYSRS